MPNVVYNEFVTIIMMSFYLMICVFGHLFRNEVLPISVQNFCEFILIIYYDRWQKLILASALGLVQPIKGSVRPLQGWRNTQNSEIG